MKNKVSVWLVSLVFSGKIYPSEADVLQKQLLGLEVPNHWRDVVKQIEDIIGREINDID